MIHFLENIILEQSLSGRKTKPLVGAIKDRHPVTFYYSGPKTPEKDSVKSGVRIRAEIVAMGLSKKGNVIVRAYVQPPSVSKKGYDKTNWRTFIVDRMSNINVLENETFDIKRKGYKEGAESDRSPMVTTYVTTNWTETPPVDIEKDIETPEPVDSELPEPEVVSEPEVDSELPEPKITEKPPITPETEDNSTIDVFKNVTPKEVDGIKYITTQEYETFVKEVYKNKETIWKNSQRELNKNTVPGMGTRKRFEIEANKEFSDMLKDNNIIVTSKIPENQNLQENINRIKTLMLLI